jgi:Transcriptional regulators
LQIENGKLLNQLFFEYITLYHQKVGIVFNIDNDIQPKCNKNQRKALFVIKQQKKMISTDLGRCLDLSKGALTALLDSIEEVGLIKREGDKKDRRKTWIELTEKGMHYTDLNLKLYEEGIDNIFKNVEDEEVLQAINNLKQLVNLLVKLE